MDLFIISEFGIEDMENIHPDECSVVDENYIEANQEGIKRCKIIIPFDAEKHQHLLHRYEPYTGHYVSKAHSWWKDL